MFKLRLPSRPNRGAASWATLVVLATSLACSSGVRAAAPNLVTNGSFELNASFVERPDVPRVADLSGSAPTGWTRDSGDVAEYMTRTPPYLGLTIYNPVDGDFFIGAHDGEWWEQTFATIAGARYVLTFSSAYGSVWWTSISSYYRPGMLPGQVTLTGNAPLLTAEVAGTSPAPTGSTLVDKPFVWSGNAFEFVADSGSTTLRFAGSAIADGGFIFIDAVAVTAVPEPQPLWLVLLGLPAVWVARTGSRQRARARRACPTSIARTARAGVARPATGSCSPGT